MKTCIYCFSTFLIVLLVSSCSSSEEGTLYRINIEYDRNLFIQSIENHPLERDILLGEMKEVESLIVNRFNNIQLGGFALKIGEDIFFADSLGIHKTDKQFQYITTIFFNEDYEKAINVGYRNEGLSMFTSLQYHKGKIYFIDNRVSSIKFMYLDGSNLKTILELGDVAEVKYVDGHGYIHAGGITEFIIVNGKLYFNYFLHGARLHYINLNTGEIVDLNIASTPILTLSPDGYSIQFTYNVDIVTYLDLESHSIENAMPLNMDELIKNQKMGHMIYTTNTNGKLAFGTHLVTEGPVMYSRIFVINENGYAEEIHREEAHIYKSELYIRQISMYLNSIGDWVYFIVNIPNLSVDMYRIKNDGTNLELIYGDMLDETFATNHIFMNILSEDIIVWRRGLRQHQINVLIRDSNTGEFVNKRLN